MPATSKSQQRLMGIAYAVKKGYMAIEDVAAEYKEKVKDLVQGMTLDQLKDFAETSHEGLPNKADESLSMSAVSSGPQSVGMPGMGMGKIALPNLATGAYGSGDKTSGQGNAEEEYEKEKKKRKKREKLKTFEQFIFEKYGE
jgi:hypothetical protein